MLIRFVDKTKILAFYIPLTLCLGLVKFMDNESLESQIAKMEKRLAPLRIKHEQLRRVFESEQTEIARLEALHSEEEQLEREIAAMEGRHPGDDDE